ncbi:kinase-like domain-containing protein [Chytriomyces sp. MP71]|nr:kinase-like domain-containing protein [Chytriomyces sp. MP71]
MQRSGSEISLNEKYGPTVKASELGRGASAVVRLCSPVNTDKKYAIKEFKPRKKGEQQKAYIKKLMSEFCISSALLHENVIRTVDLIQDDRKTWCVVMEYSEGGDLFTKIAAGLLVDKAELVNCFFKQVLKGVEYLHSMGVAHRDLKPENLLLDKACRIVKITDFGVSEVFRAPLETVSKKSEGECGSGPYMAPEVFIQKEYEADMIDVWSIGIIYYVMLYNSIPWSIAKLSDARFKHYRDSKIKFWPIARLPPHPRKIIFGMLEPDVSQRLKISTVLSSDWVKSISSCQAGMPVEAQNHSHVSLLQK